MPEKDEDGDESFYFLRRRSHGFVSKNRAIFYRRIKHLPDRKAMATLRTLTRKNFPDYITIYF